MGLSTSMASRCEEEGSKFGSERVGRRNPQHLCAIPQSAHAAAVRQEGEDIRIEVQVSRHLAGAGPAADCGGMGAGPQKACGPTRKSSLCRRAKQWFIGCWSQLRYEEPAPWPMNLRRVPIYRQSPNSMETFAGTTEGAWGRSSTCARSVPPADVPGFGPACFRPVARWSWSGWAGTAFLGKPSRDRPNERVSRVEARNPTSCSRRLGESNRSLDLAVGRQQHVIEHRVIVLGQSNGGDPAWRQTRLPLNAPMRRVVLLPTRGPTRGPNGQTS